MKRAIVLAVIVAGAFAGYRRYTSDYAPVKLYKSFAEEVLQRHYDAAAALTEGMTATDVQRAGSQEKVGMGPAMFQTLFPSRYDIESKSLAADGTLTINAVQTILFNPPGVESALRPAMYAKMKQVVTMHKNGGAWKITSFENKFDSMDSASRR